MGNNKKITISDIAGALDLSTSTVSRAISGKGRISKNTVERVRKYVEEKDYTPNIIAKSLASSNTYNILFVLPVEESNNEVPFFQSCLLGACAVSTKHSYDILVIRLPENDISELKRVISNKKVNGVILTRAIENDLAVEFLKEQDVEFVLIGSNPDSKITQIDNDHWQACHDLTDKVIDNNNQKIAIIGGNMLYTVNKYRYNGFLKAVEENDILSENVTAFLGIEKEEQVKAVVKIIADSDIDILFCMDDMICSDALYYLQVEKITKGIRVASFYYNQFLHKHYPMVSLINFDVINLGREACHTVIEQIEKKEKLPKKLLGYELIIR